MQAYDFTVRRGDTFSGAQFTISVNGSPLSLVGASAKLQARNTADVAVIDLAVGTGLTINNAAGGILSIDARAFDVLPGVYPYELQITLGSGAVKTYIGGNITVLADIAR